MKAIYLLLLHRGVCLLSEKILMVEFSNGYIRLALTCHRIKTKKLYAFEKVEAPIFAGEITDLELMKRIILAYLRKNNVKNCKVKIVLHHPRGIMRFMRLPKMKTGDMDKAIKCGIEELFPPSKGSSVYDYRINSTDSVGINVVAVRIPEAVSSAYADFFISIGLKPILLDVYANAASVYLECYQTGNFDAVFESPLSVNILRFIDGKLVSSRDIRYNDKHCAATEIKSFMKLYPGTSEKVFIFTDLKIADDVFLDMKKEVHKASVQYMAFHALSETRKD